MNLDDVDIDLRQLNVSTSIQFLQPFQRRSNPSAFIQLKPLNLERLSPEDMLQLKFLYLIYSVFHKHLSSDRQRLVPGFHRTTAEAGSTVLEPVTCFQLIF